MKTYKVSEDKELPAVSESAIVYLTASKAQNDNIVISRLEQTVRLNDDIIADWLNITPRTYRNYKTKDTELKPNMREHIIMLLSLYRHGTEVFSSIPNFEKWLSSPNVFLDNIAPQQFLNTISGIQMIDHRLTALEYGENI